MTRSREVSKGATRQEFVYTATTQQTTFTGNDDSSNSLAYTVGQIDVFVNGVRQAAADYTASNGTSVILGAGASAGDTVNINAFGTFSVADVLANRLEFDYTATAGQTSFTGSDNDSQTMAYTAGRIDVYLNGSRLNQTDDYVATNGTSVVLEAGAQAGDSLVVVSHGTVNLISNVASGSFDLNGNELILDVDGDTSITADTDDQIDFKLGGTDKFSIAAATSTFSNDLTVTEANADAATAVTVFNANGVATVGNESKLHLGCTNSATHGASVIAEFTGTANTNHLSDLIFKTTNVGSSLTETMRIHGSGAITAPLQPAFSVIPAADQDNATGNGTNATVVFGTEIFDKNADFASNTFTAPVTGSYFLSASVTVHDHTSSNTTGRLHIVTSNRSYMYEFDPAENISGAGVGSFSVTVLADMDAADTSTVTMQIFDAGSAAVDIQASGTFFQGYLVG